MYKYKNGPEPDHSGYEHVDPDEQCENCGHKYRDCECGDLIEDDDPEAPLDELNYSK